VDAGRAELLASLWSCFLEQGRGPEPNCIQVRPRRHRLSAQHDHEIIRDRFQTWQEVAASTGQLVREYRQQQVRRPHGVMKDGVEGDGGV
jgi:hypothetical protein